MVMRLESVSIKSGHSGCRMQSSAEENQHDFSPEGEEASVRRQPYRLEELAQTSEKR